MALMVGLDSVSRSCEGAQTTLTLLGRLAYNEGFKMKNMLQCATFELDDVKRERT
jgi:hypothetical protein